MVPLCTPKPTSVCREPWPPWSQPRELHAAVSSRPSLAACFLERWLLFSELWGCLSTPEAVGSPSGRPEGRAVSRDRDFKGLVRAPGLGPQLQDGLSCRSGSWQNRALLARSAKLQTRTVPRGSLRIEVTAGSSQGVGLEGGSGYRPRQGLHRRLPGAGPGAGGAQAAPQSPPPRARKPALADYFLSNL